jgi:error-prone DNA polymerase
MIQRADTVGVFQIESRAQMTMLPRLKPECFHDLVVEVAIVRPGPIQGGMVHPYLRRRMGQEAVSYPSPEIEAILRDTLGVPLFQEQVMELVIVAADYTPGEADQLRRSMAAWRGGGNMEPHRLRIRERMTAKGYEAAFIEQIFEQIRGFGAYGFPQSHAASFAKLVYVSCWLKCHEPEAFRLRPAQRAADGLLPAQPDRAGRAQEGRRVPAGGRAAQRLGQHPRGHMPVESARVHARPVEDRSTGVEERPRPAIRLGLREVRGLAREAGEAIVAARARAPFRDLADLCGRAALDRKAREALAEAGALRGLAGHRHAARWQVAGVERQRPLLPGSPQESRVALPAPGEGEELLSDYRALGLSLGRHPLALLRRQLRERRLLGSRELRDRGHGSQVRTAGLVTMRQKPQTASGTIFVTLEDEHGMVNVIVWPRVADRGRRALLGASLLEVGGRWERVDGVEHLVARDLQDLSGLLGGLRTGSRDFH